MPYFVGYAMTTGAVYGRGVETAAEAIQQYRALRSARAGAIQIRDEADKAYSLTDLLMRSAPSATVPPKIGPALRVNFTTSAACSLVA